MKMNELIEKFIHNFFNQKKTSDVIKDAVKLFYLNEGEVITDDESEPNEDPIDQEDQDSEPNGESLLDRANKGEDISVKDQDTGKSIFIGNVPSIYAFTTEKAKGWIKVGFTYQPVERRLDQWNEIYHDVKEFGRWYATETSANGSLVYFMDYPVHDEIKNRGFDRISKEDRIKIQQEARNNDGIVNLHVSDEFFKRIRRGTIDEELTHEVITNAIEAIKQHVRNGEPVGKNRKLYDLANGQSVTEKIMGDPADYGCTPQQDECIKNGIKAIEDGKKDLLMAAVMRFGKTHAAYEIIKRYNDNNQDKKMNYIVVTSAKADTRPAWRNDINHVDFIDDFVFIEHFNGDLYVTLKDEEGKIKQDTCHLEDPIGYYKDLGKTVIVYSTLQYLLYEKDESIDVDFNKEVDKKKSKFNLKHYITNPANVADLLIVDEAHFGSHAAAFGQITGLGNEAYDAEKYHSKKEFKAACQNKIQNKRVLQCSGTPYYILQGSEFSDPDAAVITTVSFTDMLNARNKWEIDNPSGNIEYDEDGNIIADKYTEDLSPYYGVPNIHKFGMQLTDKCRAALKDEGIETKLAKLFENNKVQFTYEDAIVELMKSIFGIDGKSMGFVNSKDIRDGRIFRHIVMILPSNYACHLMKKLLIEKHIIDENDRKIIVAVDKDSYKHDPEAEDSDELNRALNKLEAENKKSLTITDQKFLTGVSVPLWDSMLYMKDTKSPQDYDQAIFRLCTRNTVPVLANGEPVRRSNGKSIKRNAKSNVYLVDFNIDRMYEMAIRSAKAMCKANTDKAESYDQIEDALKKSMDSIPMYEEPHVYKDADEVLGNMHKVNIKDLMKFYVNYNQNKSVEDQIDDAFNDHQFDAFCENLSNVQYLQKFGKAIVGVGKADPNDPGKDAVTPNDLMGYSEEEEGDEGEGRPAITAYGKADKDQEKAAKEAYIANQQYMKGMIKTLLYCDICMPEPIKDMEEFLTNADESILDLFGVKMDDFKDVWDRLSTVEKKNINNLLINIYELYTDSNIKDPVDRAMIAIKKLGRLDDRKAKGEDKGVALVITPPELVNKMIDKVPAEEMKKAESILEVNSKYGEFLVGIYKKYGKSVAEKVKIVPGDNRCKAFCKKILNLLGISEYNIMEIEDLDGNGKYDVKDFLKLENSEILDMNKGKKFDVCLMNPPYGSCKSGAGSFLHFEFADKCSEFSNINVCVMPFRMFRSSSAKYNKFKEDYNKHLISVEEYPSDAFADTGQGSVGIYVFGNKANSYTDITYIDKSHKNVDNLFVLDVFTDYEREIVKYLENNKPNYADLKVRNNHIKKDPVQLRKFIYDTFPKRFNKNDYFLLTNLANGAMNGKFISGAAGGIYDFNGLIEYAIDSKAAVKNIMHFKSIKAAKNCKVALENPLLRFTCFKMQDDQGLTSRVYKYVPNIDWEDDRVLTDEGLLEVCGCPTDKAKEYAEYCKKYIKENVDKD